MTIVVGIATPDGLVLAADSRTTRNEEGRTRIASDSAQKVFRICDGSFGVACYGAALFQEKTVAGHMDEFEANLASIPDNVEEVAHLLGAFFQKCLLEAFEAADTPWLPEMGPQLGFQVAGYRRDGVGHLIDVQVPGDKGPVVAPTGIATTNIGIYPQGQDDVISRLLHGVDINALAGSGIEVPEEVSKALAGLEYTLLYPLTLQDAVDCATFLISTTIGMQRFSDGTAASPGGIPGCGGPIRILAITRKKSHWVSPPTLIGPT